jgi:ribosome maturation factor RimP
LFCGGLFVSALESILEPTLAGLGFELVDLQVSNRGRFLRVFMDKPGGITVDDCATVSRHLSRLLEVEGVDYDRMEVSSPGLDRPLRKAADFARFAGSRVEVKMRIADAQGRRRYTGLLQGTEGEVVKVLVDGDGEGREVALNVNDMDKARLVPDLQAKDKR